MKAFIAIILCCMWGALPALVSEAWAEFVPPENVICPAFQWNPSDESDLAGYRFYPDAVSMALSVRVSKDLTEIECGLLQLPEGAGSGMAGVTAVDTSGNESDMSILVPYAWLLADKTPPDPVTGFCETMESPNGGLVRVCTTVTPIE